MLNNILVAIDQSSASQRAYETALEMAKALDARLILAHALDVFDPASPERPTIHVYGYSMELDDILRKTYERQWAEFADHYDALMRQKQEEAKAAGVTVISIQPYGRPGPAICESARTYQADLIVVGSHGRTGLRELMLGSVSNYIMHHAPCSVMLVHPDGRRDPVSPGQRSGLNAATVS